MSIVYADLPLWQHPVFQHKDWLPFASQVQLADTSLIRVQQRATLLQQALPQIPAAIMIAVMPWTICSSGLGSPSASLYALLIKAHTVAHRVRSISPARDGVVLTVSRGWDWGYSQAARASFLAFLLSTHMPMCFLPVASSAAAFSRAIWLRRVLRL